LFRKSNEICTEKQTLKQVLKKKKTLKKPEGLNKTSSSLVNQK
jgi:hypothetical protein